MDRVASLKGDLAFTCVYEVIPESSMEVDILFKYARWLQKGNALKQVKSVDIEVERLYRIAAEQGHHKANINLQAGAMRGFFTLNGRDHLRLSQELIASGVATGYYFIGVFLQQGGAGLVRDPEMALRYFRKSADEGSPQGQSYIANKLEPVDIAPIVANAMYRCAAEQGHGGAAARLGIGMKLDKQYAGALSAFQLGVAGGDETSAGYLESAFSGPLETDRFNYLGQKEDKERARRYNIIRRILARYSYANPKVPEINEIVPLPPAPLPEWDGKLQWLEERLANIPPEKPSEELIKRLAVDGYSAIDAIGPYQGGGGGCCYIAPQRWVPGLKVRVDWETGAGNSKGFPGFADRDEYEAWAAPLRAMKRRHSEFVAIPDYTGQSVCGITVHFLPCDQLQATTSCWSYGNPEYPIKTPLQLPEPQSCPK